MGALLQAFRNLLADLLQTYIEEGVLLYTGPPWSRQALECAINNGPHASTCSSEITPFIRREVQRRLQYGFSIFLTAADAIRMFRDKLKLSHIAAFPQAHH